MERNELKITYRAVYKVVDTILWEEWDPIGVNREVGARDEYENYVPQIVSLIIRKASRDQIASTLNDIVQKQIGLDGNIQHCLTIADHLISQSRNYHLE
jgi:hypothetical protein